MSDMKITALAPWFVGKRNLAPMIVAELGPSLAEKQAELFAEAE